ncbi:GAF domain-containing protein [Deinococcus aestuarii]|uniref:GAF domain-containing protein n=1 Tax=Deinococcus aestuarii TaxID=2774531 RepID=UPI001C0AAD7F|nr:GAF domain-containing protein [Deinococcus aestuarii]
MPAQPVANLLAHVSLSEHLQGVTEALSASRTQAAVFSVVLRPALSALKAVAGAVLLVDERGERLEIAAAQGDEEGAQTLWQDGPLNGNVPAGDALKRHEPLFFEAQGDLTRAYPELEARTGGVAAVATAVLPMFLDDRPLGAIILDFKEPHEFTPEESRFLRILAAQCALALGRVQATRQLERRVEERTQELEAERNFLRTLLGSLGESIVACDAQGRLTLFNGVARELHGLDAEPVPPETWAEHYGLYQPDGKTLLAPAQVPLYRAWEGQIVENAEMVVRPAGGEARTLLVNGQPILDPDGKRLGAVVAQRDITGRQGQARDLAAARTRAEVLAALGDALQRAASPEEVAQFALDRIGPAVGARGMLVVRLEGEVLHLPTVWGDVPETVTAYLNRPGRTLNDATTFRQVVRSGQAVYLDSYRPRRGTVPSFPPQAAGVEPIRSPAGTLVGFLLASRPVEVGVWQDGERDLLSRAAATLGLALERAAATRQLEEERAALDAFVAYQEAVGGESDVLALARQAVRVVCASLAHVSAAYYELEDGRWKARAWSDDIPPEIVAQIRAGIPWDAPHYAGAAGSGQPVFADGWDAGANRVQGAESYGAAAFLPLVIRGETHGLFSVGTQQARAWTEREKALVRAVARGLKVTLERTTTARHLAENNAELAARTRALEGFAELSRDLALEGDAVTLVGRAQELLVSLLPASVSTYYEAEGDTWRLRSHRGEFRNPALLAALQRGLPRGTTLNVDRPFDTRQPFYQDRFQPDTVASVRREIGHIRTTAAFPVVVGEQVRGVLLVGRHEPRSWTPVERSLLETALRNLCLALERGESVAQLAAHSLRIEESARAQEAFVAYTEAVGTETDVPALAGRAVEVLRAHFPESSVGYFEPEGELWRARVWSPGFEPDLLNLLRAGVPPNPLIREVLRTHEAVFVDGWDAAREEVAGSGHFESGMNAPLVVAGEVRGILGLGRPSIARWEERDRALVRAVARGLTLALERAEGARRLEAQNAELEARARALEAFADLTRDLAVQGDPRAFVRRAQEVVLSLLPPGYALYYEREGERWRNRVQTGEVGHADLQAFIDAGPPVGVTPSVDVPWTTGEPFYQDSYARGSDTPAEMVQHVSTVASLPVMRRGEVVGVLIAVLFEARTWTPTDRVVLETVAQSLDLALERAEGVADLARRTEELSRSNAELEQFAYVASHDLQAPIRAITSFAGVIDRRYGPQLDGRGRLYLRQIVEGGEHMKRLVDDLLAFSRVHTGRGELLPVDTGAVFDAVARRLQPETPPGTSLTRGRLPVVLADAQQLDQLLQNLIANGMKYRRPGVVPQVHVSAQREGEGWRFAVQDNGIGIEPQYFERIFVIFQRLHGREEYEGTGIGLAVCKKIVERHGGRLWVESTPGQGSTFFYTLPGG